MILVRPGDSGLKVSALQQLLEERGLLSSDARLEQPTAVYGPATQACVRTFQAKFRLTVDGLVGDQTWNALNRALEKTLDMPAPDFAAMSALMLQAITVAMNEFDRGVKEIPMGANRGPDVDGYLLGLREDGKDLVRYQRGNPCAADGFQGAPWCARFALWAIETAAAQMGLDSPVKDWGDLASSAKWLRAATARGRLTDSPLPGRIGLLLTSANGQEHGHVVFVTNLDGGFQLATLEGNSGNRVNRHWRNVNSFAGFVGL